MARKKQLWLPEVKGAKRLLKNPQPQGSKLKRPRKFELLHHPFDLRFRGRINKWLKKVEADNVNFSRLLSEVQLKAVRLYFFPQGENNKWLIQDEVLKYTDVGTKAKLRQLLVDALEKIWDERRALK